MVPRFLTHYHPSDTPPFVALSALPDQVAIPVMERLFRRHQGSVLYERFRDPAAYLRERRESEASVRSAFAARGGRPIDSHPISMVLGRSPFLERHAPGPIDRHRAVRVPLADLDEREVSFTFPDSMVSQGLWRDRPAEFFLPDLHGKVFTLSEILSLVEARGMPEESWNLRMPPDLGAYIEAQVWNRACLLTGGDGRGGPALPRWPSLPLEATSP